MISKKLNDKIAVTSEVRLALFLLVVIGIFGNLSIFINKPTPAPLSDVQTIPVIVSIDALSSKEIRRGDISKKQVIFTFDGGDGDQSARKILEILAKHNVKGSFFLTGKFVEEHKDLARSISLLGHEIYSHTYGHPRLTMISDKDIYAEMIKTEQIFGEVIGISPKPYFRAPFGDRDERVLVDTFRAGYQSVYWTVDALDWEESAGRTALQVKERILSNIAPGNIYLMHLGDTITGDILDEVFTSIEERGYKIVSLKEGI